MHIFVPLTDDFPVDSLSSAEALVPYRCGLPCQHRLRKSAEDNQRTAKGSSGSVSISPTSRSSRLAAPPLSSST